MIAGMLPVTTLTAFAAEQPETVLTLTTKNGSTESDIFTYGDVITIEATAISGSTVAYDQTVNVYNGDSQIGTGIHITSVAEDGTYTIMIDTIYNALDVGEKTLTVKFEGDDTMSAAEADVTLTLNMATPYITANHPSFSLTYPVDENILTDSISYTFTNVRGLTSAIYPESYEYRVSGSEEDFSSGLPANAGTYEIRALFAPLDDDYYLAGVASFTLEIKKIHANIRMTPAFVYTKTYDGTPFIVTEDMFELNGITWDQLTHIWYKNSVAEENKLTAAPTEVGNYVLVLYAAETTNVDEIFWEAPSVTITDAAPDSEPTVYKLWVGGEQFTSEKLSVSGGEGTATYDPDTNTLTLNNYTYEGEGYNGDAIYYSGTDTLNLVLSGTNSIAYAGNSRNFSFGMYIESSIDISGEGNLSVIGGEANLESNAIYVGQNITISGGEVTAVGGKAGEMSSGVYCISNLTVTDNGSLIATGGEGGSLGSFGIYNVNGITVDGGTVTATGGTLNTYAPSAGIFSVGSVTISAGVVKASGGAAGQSAGLQSNGTSTISGGEVIAQGETWAFYGNLAIDSAFANAVCWYGENEEVADAAGAKRISKLEDNYNQKYVRIAEGTVAPGPAITVTNSEHGTITADKATAEEGETVTLTITPEEGYVLKSVTINGSKDEMVLGKSEVSFTMPDEDVSVSAEFGEGIVVYFDNSQSQWTYVLFRYDNGYDEGMHIGNDIYAFIVPANTVGQFTNYMTGMPEEMFPEGIFRSEEFEAVNGETYTYTSYDIVVDYNITGGTVEVTDDEILGLPIIKASPGQTIWLTVTPDDGYVVDTVKYNDGEDHIITPVDDTYSFVMPASEVVVTATFKENISYPVWVGGQQFSWDQLTIEDASGGVATYVPESSTLILSNINISTGYVDEDEHMVGIYSSNDLNIELRGENNITMPDYNNSSYGIHVSGDLIISGSGSLNVVGGNVETQEYGVYYSNGIHTSGQLSIHGARVYAKGGDVFAEDMAHSRGVYPGKGLEIDFGGSLLADGGSVVANKAYSSGVEVLRGNEYVNFAVHDGTLIAKGGDTEGTFSAESAGVYLGFAGLYVYENTANVELSSGNAKVTFANETYDPYACSNGIVVYSGDIAVYGGTVNISGGTWEGKYGDGWAAYVTGDVFGEDVISGGNVLIECEEIEPSLSGYGFAGTKVTITSSDEKRGVIYAQNRIEIGDKLIISQPEGGKVAEPGNEKYGFGTILNADDSLARNVVIEPSIHSVKIEGTDNVMSVLVPDGMSINEAYKDMLEKADLTDFSEIINTEKSGYKFSGFYTESGEKFDFSDSVTVDMTITAKWKRKSYVSSDSSGTSTTTTKNEDGSTTKTTTNKATGTTTETTTYPDGSTTKVETKKDGTVTTTEKDKDGNTTTTTLKPDGTSTTTEKNKDGSEKVTEEKTDGTTITTEKDTDGTKTVTTENPDGSTKTEIDLPKDKETEVTIPAPNAKDVTSITVTDKDGKETEITDFEITEDGVKFTVSEDCTVTLIKGEKKEFADVHPAGHWAAADIDYAYIKGLMMGTSENHFSPDVPLTRAMLVTVLYRLEGEPATNKSIPFADVDMGAYYGNAVSWAKQNGIVNGVSETEFAPNDNITREQIAAIMHRYAQYKGYDVSVGENTNILSYDDFDSISEYAIASMQYTCGSGLIKGKTSSTLNPLDNATRAEIAAILHRFIETN